jgi:hypothetical protein
MSGLSTQFLSSNLPLEGHVKLTYCNVHLKYLVMLIVKKRH